MKKLFFYLFSLLCALSVTSCVQDIIDVTGDVFGIVSNNETNEPVRGAEITLSPGNATTVTGFDGHFEFKDLEPKTYKMQITANGYQTNTKQVTVTAGQNIQVDINLTPVKAVAGISLSHDNFNFGSTHTEQTLSIENTGNNGTVSWEIIGVDVAWLKVSPTSGSIAQGKSVAVKMVVDRSKLATDEASTTFMVNAAGGSQAVRVSVNKPTVTGVKGYVYDANNNSAIKGCLVTINPGNRTMTTGEDGLFKFTELSSGEHTLTFEKTGYYKETQTVSISTGNISSLDALLEPMAPFTASVKSIDFGDKETEKKFSLINNSDAETSFYISNVPEWLTLNKSEGLMQSGSEIVITTTLDRKKVSNGTYSENIRISYSGRTQGDIMLEVKFIKSETTTDSDVWDGKIAKDFAGGTGTKYDPYIVKTGGQLLLIKDYSSKCFKLANDIDLNNKNWLPIETFSGTIDGDGHTVYNLRVERDEITYRGLIGTIKGTVKNLTIKGVKINGNNSGAIAGCADNGTQISNCTVTLTDGSVLNGTKVGGLIGYIDCTSYSDQIFIDGCTVETTNSNISINGNYVGGIIGHAVLSSSQSNGSKIQNCNVNCDVYGEKYVGGLIGYNTGYSSVESCEYQGNVSGTQYVGGIAGMHTYSTIAGCKVSGNIEGTEDIGGICGENSSGKIIASYSHCNITAASAAKYVGGITGSTNTYIRLCYSASTCNHSNFEPICYNNSYNEYREYCYSVYDANVSNIALKMEDAYSDYADYWNFSNTWTWKGTINGESKQVICPRLAWER